MSSVELAGHVTLVNGFDLPNFNGCYALITLSDPPANTIAVLTGEHKLQTLLETALSTGYLVRVHGVPMVNTPPPTGSSWDPGIDVYGINQVTLYNTP